MTAFGSPDFFSACCDSHGDYVKLKTHVDPVSFVQKENHRVSGMAGAPGVVAIAWEFVLIGVVVVVVLFLLANPDL